MKTQKDCLTTSTLKANTNAKAISILFVVGLMLFVSACAPSGNTGRTISIPTPLEAITELAEVMGNVASTSFEIQWEAPEGTGIRKNGTSLSPSEIVYRIYYRKETTAGELKPNAESIKADPSITIEEVTGITSAEIEDLTSATRYFIMVASYNPEADREVISDEVIEVSTTASGTPFIGTLSYGGEEHEFMVRNSGTIRPILPEGTPEETSPLSTGTSNVSVSYTLVLLDDTGINPPPTVKSTGIVAVNSVANLVSVRYLVRAEAEGYITQEVALRITIVAVDFEGESLSYGETSYVFDVKSGGTITPTHKPEKSSTDDRNDMIVYSWTKSEGTDFDSEQVYINESNGEITILSNTNSGSATYIVRAVLSTYNTQEVMLTINIVAADFEGASLSYRAGRHEFAGGAGGMIELTGTPSIPEADSMTRTIVYSIRRSSGDELSPAPSINASSGVITIKSDTSAGTATYTVKASSATKSVPQVMTPDYNTQEVTLIISISAITLQVSTYHSGTTETFPVELGQAAADVGMFALPDDAEMDDSVILTISNLAKASEYIIYSGTLRDNGYTYSEIYRKTTSDDVETTSGDVGTTSGGVMTILKSELTTHNFSFEDGAVIGISGSGIEGKLHVATYRPSNIYNHYDLQAMRVSLDLDYVLQNDIDFIPKTIADTAVSNYEAVGTVAKPFEGSLNGADGTDNTNYTISGIEIVGTDNYQGLFGVMEASSADTTVAQNLVLRNFKIKANAVAGSLAGWIEKGTIDNVSVEVDNVDAGKVEVSGNIEIGGITSGYGGGLLGRAGAVDTTDVTDVQVTIQNTSSAVAVSRTTGTNKGRVGGLVGYTDSDVMLIESSATGSVTSEGDIAGGLVGHNHGTVSNSYATGVVTATGKDNIGGLVGSNGPEGTVSNSYATESVTGKSSIGGLVGYNGGTVTGYATGPVEGKGNNIGGLVGSNAGTVTGYATGNVRGVPPDETETGYYIGGLVGYSTSGTVTGYATGSVTGIKNEYQTRSAWYVGGLIGWHNSGTVSGYATGEVRGPKYVGGLIGHVGNSGTVSGYARNIVRRIGGGTFHLGRVIAELFRDGTDKSYHSVSESRLYLGTGTTEPTVNRSGISDGTPVTVSASTTQADFRKFVFASERDTDGNPGPWIWVSDGNWPAINIGDVQPASAQPVEPGP